LTVVIIDKLNLGFAFYINMIKIWVHWTISNHWINQNQKDM